MANKPEPTKPTLWDIYLAVGVGKVGIVGLLLGTVEAPYERQAIAKGVEQAERYKAAEAAGTLHQKQPVIIGPPRVRVAPPSKAKAPVVDILSKAGGDGGGQGASGVQDRGVEGTAGSCRAIQEG